MTGIRKRKVPVVSRKRDHIIRDVARVRWHLLNHPWVADDARSELPYSVIRNQAVRLGKYLAGILTLERRLGVRGGYWWEVRLSTPAGVEWRLPDDLGRMHEAVAWFLTEAEMEKVAPMEARSGRRSNDVIFRAPLVAGTDEVAEFLALQVGKETVAGKHLTELLTN